MGRQAIMGSGDELRERIGAGSYASVYRALCLSNEREVAVKVLPRPAGKMRSKQVTTFETVVQEWNGFLKG